MGGSGRARRVYVGTLFARISIAVVIACAVGTAAADDGPQLGTALVTSIAIGPIPASSAFEQLDATVGLTAWHRLHVAVAASIGTGGTADWLATAFGEVGLWLHASPRVDVLLGWRLGHSWFSIRDMPVDATMTATLVQVRLRLRPRVDLMLEPLRITGYYNGLWALIAGPAIGIAVPW